MNKNKITLLALVTVGLMASNGTKTMDGGRKSVRDLAKMFEKERDKPVSVQPSNVIPKKPKPETLPSKEGRPSGSKFSKKSSQEKKPIQKQMVEETTIGKNKVENKFNQTECLRCKSRLTNEDELIRLSCGHIMHQGCAEEHFGRARLNERGEILLQEWNNNCLLCKKNVRDNYEAQVIERLFKAWAEIQKIDLTKDVFRERILEKGDFIHHIHLDEKGRIVIDIYNKRSGFVTNEYVDKDGIAHKEVIFIEKGKKPVPYSEKDLKETHINKRK